MEKFKKVIGLILIVVGLAIIGTIAIKKIETNKKQNELKKVLEEVVNDKEDTTEEGKNKKKEISINGYTPIALIEIPSISLEQGLVEGVTDDILKYYLGHFEDSVKPGENGNFAIAGHRVSDFSEAFANLYKVQAGDKIIVKYNKKQFTYQIEENFIVDPNNVDVLKQTNEPTITLVTCTVGSKQRVIIKGNLIETKDM